MKWWFLIACIAPQDFCSGFRHYATSVEFYPTRLECRREGSKYAQMMANAISLPVVWGVFCFENEITPKPEVHKPGEAI